MIKHFFFMILFFMGPLALTSPIPGVGSSELPQLLKNIVISEYGFRLGSSEQTFWSLQQNLDLNTRDSFQYVATNAQSLARFSINIDKFSKPTHFDSYVKKWIKEYPYFGFEILRTQVTKLGGQPCYLIDFAHRIKNKQMRQFVVVKKDFAIVMTCSDEIKKFKETSAQCADLLKYFQWTHTNRI